MSCCVTIACAPVLRRRAQAQGHSGADSGVGDPQQQLSAGLAAASGNATTVAATAPQAPGPQAGTPAQPTTGTHAGGAPATVDAGGQAPSPADLAAFANALQQAMQGASCLAGTCTRVLHA
eukprot:365920-Chlamydomonas_euryale.AAC.21